jgi:hypothetical protein
MGKDFFFYNSFSQFYSESEDLELGNRCGGFQSEKELAQDPGSTDSSI